MEKFEVVIVGGGLAGLSAAYSLAKDGIETLVLERGDYSGAKNVTGGRIYLNPIKKYLPEIETEAPLERYVSKERITLMGESASTSVEFSSDKFRQQPHHSYSVLRAKLDQWLAEKVAAAGGMVVTKTRVDDLIIEDGKVKGIVGGGDSIGANVVLAADGVMSLLAERAGLRTTRPPADYAVGIKEIIALPRKTIEDRFALDGGEGIAQIFMGSLTQGMFGGGFLYTNLESVSLGLVIRISDLAERESINAPALYEEFKQRPEIHALIRDGEVVEYSAHVIPEGGFRSLPSLYSDGILLAGDAAGFTLNTGLTVRGMEFAIASGFIAAEAIKKARAKNDFSRDSLSVYQTLLAESFVLRDMKTFKDAPQALDNPRLFDLYPQTICNLMEALVYIGEEPKRKLATTAISNMRRKLGWRVVKDIAGVMRL